MIAPFHRCARYRASLDAVGRLVELGRGLARISAINTARGVQDVVTVDRNVLEIRRNYDSLEFQPGTDTAHAR